ncbi:DUF6643 family protein [Streptomyces sp. NPDC048208]|uniref:DUF6643 family protein n=1 Tax=unclassified Streptomyces TaxID=2593676 RepID=UPI001369386E|nr:DUF6643 family protein [Streptomyces sp. SID4982]MYS15755.1 hypothetical protein [Streptomyces sp. SID4982]
MTSPRSTYGGGYYSASFPDTPIYDSLVAERGTPQIAPIRVPAAYDSAMGMQSMQPSPGMPAPGGNLPALPSALPALPAAPSPQPPAYGYPQAQQAAPMQPTPTAYIPQQAGAPRGYPGAQPQQPRPAPGTGYEAMRPAAPRPPQQPYQEQPYNNQQYRGY